jgi:hypothetical protein
MVNMASWLLETAGMGQGQGRALSGCPVTAGGGGGEDNRIHCFIQIPGMHMRISLLQ